MRKSVEEYGDRSMGRSTGSDGTGAVECVVHSGSMDVRAETRGGGCDGDGGGEGRWA